MSSDYYRVFRAFSDERRLQVLDLLMSGEQCACILLQKLDISQPTLSYHMKILCQSGIVKERPVGPWKYYSINTEGCEYAQKLLQALSFGGENIEIRFIKVLARLARSVLKTKEECKSGNSIELFGCCCNCRQ